MLTLIAIAVVYAWEVKLKLEVVGTLTIHDRPSLTF